EKIWLGDDVVVISSDMVEGSGDWNSPEYQDMAGSKGKKVVNALSFYKMKTNEISERYIAPCFVNGLEAYDGEVNLGFDENMISNEFAVKLCLDYEVKKGKKLVKKELIVTLKGELYFVKFIINLEEDDFEPGVILGRSFLRLAHRVVDFGNGVIIIYPKPDPFKDDSEKIGKSSDDWDQLLDFNFNDVPKFKEELPPFVCKMGKSNRNKKIAMENLNLFYQDIRPSSSAGGHLSQEEVEKEALAIRISQKFALLEEERHVVGVGRGVKEKRLNMSKTDTGIGLSMASNGTRNEVCLVGDISTVLEGVTPSMIDMTMEKDKLSSFEDTTILGTFPPLPTSVTTSASNAPAFSEDGLSGFSTKLGTPLMLDSCTSDMNNKKGMEPTIEVSNSNLFDVLNSVDNDGEFEQKISEGKLRLLDNEGNPLVPTGIVESDSEVEV
nr:hypothetical protein [Tanacetum cinerariifolium]